MKELTDKQLIDLAKDHQRRAGELLAEWRRRNMNQLLNGRNRPQ